MRDTLLVARTAPFGIRGHSGEDDEDNEDSNEDTFLSFFTHALLCDRRARAPAGKRTEAFNPPYNPP